MGLDRIRVVLVRPRGAANVGAVARAIKNMGLGPLVLVAPHRFSLAEAERMAVHAGDVLAARRTAAILAEAVAPCTLVVGTVGRTTAAPAEIATPRALAPAIVAASAASEVALVFGPEDHGLANAELGLCQRVISIPASPAYESLNLAQAVMICAYELFLAAGADAPAPARVLAPSAELERMYDKLEGALGRIGYLHRDNAAHMMATLRRILGRATLDEKEARVFLGLAHQIEWAARNLGPRP
jgi:tRNA/rRNA methyltransferase